MDEKSLQVLEFPKVRQRVAGYTGFSGGEKLALSLVPTSDPILARRWQQQTAEALVIMDSQREVTIGGARDVRRPADNALLGFTLPTEDFLDIRNTLVAANNLQRQLNKSRHQNPQLAEIASLIEDCPGLVKAIDLTLDDRGDVLDSASTRLGNIRKELRVAHGRIQDKLQRLLNSSLNQYLQEPIITMRSGRYVVPVRIEARGRVKGIVHDQSGSGATLWVEPMGTVDLNNEFRGLQAQEAQEIARILAELTALVAEHAESLKRIVDRIAEIDLIFARARYASATRAVMPEFVEWRTFPAPKPPKHANEQRNWEPPPPNPHPGSTVWIRQARHPLLPPDSVVPTDLTLDDETFQVLITGPNTGGKTVSLKTMGLMVLMAQAGMHLPVLEARLTIFDNVYADIGDEQSIEQSLSTFSAHITNIIHILKQANDHSLVLLDELGSGTDPTEGAALAQSIISFLRDKGATTFIATHYPALKVYATQTKGATNASLLFDVDTLAPTYELSIGLPGKSNALVIARRLGLDTSVLDEALELVGSGNSRAEALLDSIHDIRERISSQEAASRLALRKAESQQQTLDQRLTEIDEERSVVLRQAKAEAEEELAELRHEIRRIRRGLRDAQSRTAVKKLSQELQQLEEEGVSLSDREPLVQQKRRRPDHFEVGDIVQVTSINAHGEVLSVQGDEAMVAVGRMQLRTRTRDLELKERAEDSEQVAEEQSSTRAAAISPGLELDIRGQRVEEGTESVDRYLDQAFRANLPWVRIVHGKGTGRLREAIRHALTRSSHVASWEPGREGEGDDGVTVAHLKLE